tara:strand:- start:885 stop:2933 length:2049 start_codon:yes stop_codon:yes gene_type:complete
MENKNSPTLGFNVERVTKVLFACNNQDDLIYLTDDDFKLLDENGEVTSKYDENIFIQLAKKGSSGLAFGGDDKIMRFFPQEFKDNLDFFMKIASSMTHFHSVFLSLASEKILNNENFAKAIVQNCGSSYESVLKHFSEDVCNNKEIVLSAVEKNGSELKNASESLRKDREVVVAALKNSGNAVQYANKLFLSDFEIARIALTNSGLALQYFTQKIKKDKDIVRRSVNNNPRSLQFIEKSLLSEKDFILSLPNKIYKHAGSNFSVFSILDNKLKKDRDIVIKAIAMDCKIYEDLPTYLKEDLLIISEALKDASFGSEKLLSIIVENAPKNILEDIDTCKKIISRDLSFLEYLPKSMHSNKDIISFWSKLETKNYPELNEDDLIIFLSYISREQKIWFGKNDETTAKTLKKINTIEGAKSIVTYLGDLESDVFQNLDLKLLANEEVLNAALNAKPSYNKKTPSIMEYIVITIPEIHKNREYIEKALMKYPKLMEFFPENLKNDRVLAEIAINQDYNSFKYLSEELKDNDQIINCLVLALLQYRSESSSNNFYGNIFEFASNRIKKNKEFAEKMSNYGYVMKGFYNDKNIVMNALKHNPYAEFGDIWDFDIAQIAQVSSYDLCNDNVKHIVNNKELMGMQFILAINTNSRARDIVENTKPYFERLDYAWVTENNIGVEDEYYEDY